MNHLDLLVFAAGMNTTTALMPNMQVVRRISHVIIAIGLLGLRVTLPLVATA